MNIKFAAPIVLLTLVAGCSDHAEHGVQAAGSEPGAQQATSPVMPSVKMSMMVTEGRIAALTSKSTDCNIESVNGTLFEPSTPSIASAEPAHVSGWLIDTGTKTVPKDVMIRFESESGDKAWEQPINNWGDRGDVVSTHQNVAAYQKSGFQTELNLGEVSPGLYNIYLIYTIEGKETACGVGRRLLVE